MNSSNWLSFTLLLLLLLVSLPIIALTFPQHQQQQPTAVATYRGRFDMYSKCSDPETGRELYVGDYFTRTGRCVRVQCLGNLQIWEDRCQVPSLEENCARIPAANEFLEYPRCCPTYECKSYSANENSDTEETRIYDHYGRLLREHITQRVRVLVPHQPPDRIRPVGSNITTRFGIRV